MFVLLNVPVPFVVQSRLVVLLSLAPFKMYVPLSQIVASVPAFTIACLLIVNTMASVELTHGEADCPVRVKVTEPAVMSAAPGVYTGCNRVASSKAPVPEVLHNKLVASLCVELLKVYVPAVSQIVASVPAFTTACLSMVRIIASVALTHGEADCPVSVKVTVPVEMSAALGV